VIRNREVARGTFLLTLDAGEETVPVDPGQFFMVGFPGVRDPLLPRPFAAFDRESQRLEILYRRVGMGTDLLSRVRPGSVLQVFGPLGRGYRMEGPHDTPALVVSGGIGLASVYLLIKRLLASNRPVTLLHGVRSSEELFPLEPAVGGHPSLVLRVATEDGGQGYPGNVHDLWIDLQRREPGFAARHAAAFLCGPRPMLRAFAPELRALGVSAQVSLEANMACGYGVCQGCAVPGWGGPEGVAGRYRKVCTDGPVFLAEEVDWGAMG